MLPVHDSRASPNNELGTLWFQLPINATVHKLVIDAKLELDIKGSVSLFLVRGGERIQKQTLFTYDSVASREENNNGEGFFIYYYLLFCCLVFFPSPRFLLMLHVVAKSFFVLINFFKSIKVFFLLISP